MQIARDAGAFFFLDIKDLPFQPLIALRVSLQPRRHVVETIRQACEFRRRLASSRAR